MKIAYIAAGAAGMYCGTCIHDNTLAAALIKKGADVALVPTYTPLRTDEPDVSIARIFYGGISVYLEQKVGLYRRAPQALDRLLARPFLLKGLSRFSASTSAADLGGLTVSVLAGEEGHQRRELERLIGWLAGDFKPDLVHLTNSMFVGLARRLRQGLGVPVLCGLQGEDIFLEGLIEPYKSQALARLRQRAGDASGFVAPCQYYADFMAGYLEVPPKRIHVVPLGLNLQDHGQGNGPGEEAPFTVGYLARICPEKGFHVLVEAFRLLAERVGKERVRLAVAGYLGKRDRPYFDEQARRLAEWGLADSFVHWGEVDRAQKIAFLQQLHALSVPTVYAEPKGLFVLEALANGVPVVLPQHGAFPELVERTGGGLLVEVDSPEGVAAGLEELLQDDDKRRALGAQGKAVVHRECGDEQTAERMLAVYREYV